MHKLLHYQRYFCLIVSLILTFHLFSLKAYAANLYTNLVYPQVTSVSTTTAKPGDTIILYGKNFGAEGQLVCDGPYDQATQSFPESKLMTYKTVIGAYKQGRSPTSGIPDYRLMILSVSSDMIVAQVPMDMANGSYVIGYNAQFPSGICSGFGEILVGFARYDPLTITGGRDVATIPLTTAVPTQKPAPRVTATPIPTPTIVLQTTPHTTNSTEPATVSKTSQKTLPQHIASFFTNILQFFGFGR